MKFFHFVFDPDNSNFPPWHLGSLEELLAIDLNVNFLIYNKDPDEYGKQDYWVTEDVIAMYPDFLKGYKLTPVDVSLDYLREIGAKSALPEKMR